MSGLPAHTRRLSALVNRPGGITADEAVKAAEARLEMIRDSSVQEIAAMIDHMQQIVESSAERTVSNAAARDELYSLSNAVVGVAGVFGMGELGEVAFSLCTLLDLQQTPPVLKSPAVQLHLDSLRLMFNSREDTNAKRKIVDALQQMTGHVSCRR